MSRLIRPRDGPTSRLAGQSPIPHSSRHSIIRCNGELPLPFLYFINANDRIFPASAAQKMPFPGNHLENSLCCVILRERSDRRISASAKEEIPFGRAQDRLRFAQNDTINCLAFHQESWASSWREHRLYPSSQIIPQLTRHQPVIY